MSSPVLAGIVSDLAARVSKPALPVTPATPTSAATTASNTLPKPPSGPVASTSTWMLHDLDGTLKVDNTTGTTGAWTTWGLSTQVPSGATHVLLDCQSAQGGPDGVGTLSYLLIRKDSSSPSRTGCAGRSAAAADATGSANQSLHPVSASGSIQYNASSDFSAWSIAVVGYYK